MQKIDITLSFDEEKMKAIELYLRKGNTTIQKRMDEFLRQLYEQIVPEDVREYLDCKSASASSRPKRPAKTQKQEAPMPQDYDPQS